MNHPKRIDPGTFSIYFLLFSALVGGMIGLTCRHDLKVEYDRLCLGAGLMILLTSLLLASRQARINLASTRDAALLHSLPNGLVIADQQGRICQINQQAARLIGQQERHLAGQPLENYLPDIWRGAGQAEAFVAGLAVDQVLVNNRLQLKTVSGEIIPVVGRIVKYQAFASDQLIVNLTDISVLEATRRELQRAQESAALATQAKNEFLTTMSDEIVVRDAAPLRILIADEDPAARKLLAKSCDNLGWQHEEVENGLQMAVRIEEEYRSGGSYDGILLDWSLSARDSLAEIERLTKTIGVSALPRTVLVTDHNPIKLENSMKEVRPDLVLRKPVAQETLRKSMTKLVGSGSTGAELIGGPLDKPLAGLSLLAVDDSPVNLHVLGRLLENEGATVTLCPSGDKALEMLTRDPHGYQLVLMDLHMPDLDGCETSRRIRHQLLLDRLPIVALTASATMDEQQRAKAAGMDDFLMKPAEPELLVLVIRRNLGEDSAAAF